MFEEKETSWERDKQREKEYSSNYKQELEVYTVFFHWCTVLHANFFYTVINYILQIMKETLLKEEKKTMKEKFELATEKARIEAILTLEGTNHVSDILQVRVIFFISIRILSFSFPI